jgi:predicted ATPase/DNA-binding SARP family transcriptional activator/Tfp pilus assembly protein PilF
MPALTATAGLAVTYRRQYRRCGSPRCRRCANGATGHGPYWYAFWSEGGRTRSRYLGKDLPPNGAAAPLSGDGATASDGRRADPQETAGPTVQEAPLARPAPSRPPSAATTIPALRVRTLGAFAVWRGEEALPEGRWVRGKVGALFKLLLSAPRHTLPTEQASDQLWPEADPPQSAANLRSTVRFLRAVLDGPAEGLSYLRTSGALLALDPAPGGVPPADWLDADSFARAARATLAGTNRAACRDVLARYGGAYLPDDLYEDWADARRSQLARLHERLLLHLARLAEREDDAAEAIWALRAVLTTDSCQEEAARALMRVLLAEGRPAEALRVYRGLARALREELAVVPARETEALQARIRLHAQAPAPPPAAPNNLPGAATSFVGREAELAALEHALLRGQAGQQEPGARLLTLVGVGGTGKTRLALALAEAALAAYSDGVWLVELAPLAPSRSLDPMPIVRAAVPVLGLREQPGQALLKTLTGYLKDRRLLLVLDNCEHLVAACAALAARLLADCRGLQLLVTSREALGMAGETLWPVPPLALPPAAAETPPELVIRAEAVQLFVARAQAARPGFALTAANARGAAAICRGLDGLPLAIELAAARLHGMAVEEVAARLDDRFRLLRRGNRAALPRHQTLQAALDWGWDLLSEQERALLRRLAAFSGGWTLAASELVCAGVRDGIEADEVLTLLDGLVSKSFAHLEAGASGTARYGLLETVRQYAAMRLAEAGEGAAVRDRHLTWCVALAEASEPHLMGAGQAEWLGRLEAEHDNLRAALRWAQDSGEYALGLRLAGALWRFWHMHGHLSEGRRWLAAMLARPEGVLAVDRARALNGAGVLALHQGDPAQAAQHHEACLVLRRTLGDAGRIADSLTNLGNVAVFVGELDRAAALYEQSLDLRRALGDRWGEAAALNNLARVVHQQGDHSRAAMLFEQSAAIYRALGDRAGTATALDNLGVVVGALGEYERAATLHLESLAMRRELHDPRSEAGSLTNLGDVALQQGAYARATTCYREGLSRYREVGDMAGIAASLEGLARAAGACGQWARTAWLLGAATSIRETIRAPLPSTEQRRFDGAEATARAALGAEQFEASWARGRASSLERAVMAALGSQEEQD